MIPPRMLAAGLLPRDAPLYRDRGTRCMSPAPPAGTGEGDLPGFRVETRGDWAYLYPLCALPEICGFPPDDLAERLKRFSGEFLPAQLLLAGCLKAVERPVPAEIARWEKRLRQSAAEAMRTGRGRRAVRLRLALAEAKRGLKD